MVARRLVLRLRQRSVTQVIGGRTAKQYYMNFRERTLAIFRREPLDNIVYQPRIEHWYNVNKRDGTLPDRYRDMSLLEVYDDLGCSIRSYGFFNPCLKFTDGPGVTREHFQDGQQAVTRLHTAVGTVETRHRFTSYASHTDKFPIEGREDARVVEYWLRGVEPWFDLELFGEQDEICGDRAAPMVYIPRVNLQRLYIDLMGVENTFYALADDRAMVERLIKVIDETDERIIDVLAASPIPIVNFGDNVDQHFMPPPLFEEFVLPVYQHRARRFREAGKFTHAHWDGSAKLLLRYARETGMDGIEALTPVPQGDVTISEIKDALGDMVLLDGIPMTSFLPNEPLERLEEQTRAIIELFSPNLVLGISDEPSPVCDIERVRRAAEILTEYEREVREEN